MKFERKKAVQYLRVIGRLLPDNRLIVRHSYLSETAKGVRADGANGLAAELYDGEDRLLLRQGLAAKPYFDAGEQSDLAVRGSIPFPAATRLVKFVRDNIVVHQIRVSEKKPVVHLTWKPSKTVAGSVRVTWKGGHPEKSPLRYCLRYSHTNGKSWQPIGAPTDGTSRTVQFQQLPGGMRCRIEVMATDGVNTTRIQSPQFGVPVKPCVAMILEPLDGLTIGTQQEITLRGQGFYLEEREPETKALTWTSSKQGVLGNGANIYRVRLSAGVHKIRLTAGYGKRAGRAEISVRVARKAKRSDIGKLLTRKLQRLRG